MKANETTVALVARTVCAPDSLACIIVRPHQIVYRDRTWVVGSDGHRFLAIAVDDTPYCPDTPATIEGKVLNMIDPWSERVIAHYDNVDDRAFRDWIGPHDWPYWLNAPRPGIIGGKPFNRNAIASLLCEFPDDAVRRIRVWIGTNGVHNVTLDSDAWRITVAGLEDKREYARAPQWVAEKVEAA